MAQLDGRRLTQIVNVRLVGQAKHADRVGYLLHLCYNLVSDEVRLVLVALACRKDNLSLRRELLVDKPRVNCDAVAANTDTRGQDVNTRMAVCQLDQLKYVNAHLVADDGQLVCVSDIDITEGILGQLAHFGGQVVGLVNDTLLKHLLVDGCRHFSSLRRAGADDAVIVLQLVHHVARDNAFRTMCNVNLIHRNAGFLAQYACEHLGGVRRHGGLQNDQIGRLEHLACHTACRLYKAQIGLVAAVLVLEERRRHRNIKYIGLAKLFGKMQMTVCNSLFKGFLQTRLYNMDMTTLQGLDGIFVYVKAADLKTGLSQRDRRRQADITQSHDSNFHNFRTSFSIIFLHYTTFFTEFNVVFEFSPKRVYNDTIVRLCKYHKRLSEPFIFRLHILLYTPKVWKGYYDF